jgi:indolepyruvate ferredoxin oxidoreductase alpha subunit
MGAGIGQAHGITKAMGDRSLGKVAAVIGDSTFIHSGITGLLNSSYNQAISTVIILDNRFTAMTGGQEHPGTGCTMMGEATSRLEYAQLCAALGVKHIRTVNPYDLGQTLAAIKEEIERPALSVIIAEGPCIFNKREFTPFAARYAIDEEACIGCRSCILLGCPAIGWIARSAEEREAGQGERKKPKGFARIDPLLCIGCSICEQVCKSKAIAQAEAPR